MNATSRIASLLTFTTMVGLSFASAAALVTYQPADLSVMAAGAPTAEVVMLPRVEITAKRAEVAQLPTVVIVAKRPQAADSQVARADHCAPSTAVC